MKKLRRYREDTRGYLGSMIPDEDGEWVFYFDVQAYIKEFVETISIPWNVQLTSGGALNEENSIDESKV